MHLTLEIAPLPASGRCWGNRREVVRLVGFRSGKTACLAWVQSRYPVDSCVSQNARSSVSSWKAGISLCFLFIKGLLLSMHVSIGNDTNQCALPSESNAYRQVKDRGSQLVLMPSRSKRLIENVTSSLYKLWSRLAFTALDRLHAASG